MQLSPDGCQSQVCTQKAGPKTAIPSADATESPHLGSQRLGLPRQPLGMLGMSPGCFVRAEMYVIRSSSGDSFRRLAKRMAGGNKPRQSGRGVGQGG
jgi:hypothetical protein